LDVHYLPGDRANRLTPMAKHHEKKPELERPLAEYERAYKAAERRFNETGSSAAHKEMLQTFADWRAAAYGKRLPV